MTSLTVSIMQPYFIPYAGYFRLFAASDLFVIYDCVQFTRRGWLHRNKLKDTSGDTRWLTLPLAKAPVEVLIRDLEFRPDASEELIKRLCLFPLVAASRPEVLPILTALRTLNGTPVDYISELLKSIVVYCELPWRVVRSSSLDVPLDLRGQDRIIEIARRLGATRYVNAPGGKELYDSVAFQKAGIELRFLAEYQGPLISSLQSILDDNQGKFSKDVRNTMLMP